MRVNKQVKLVSSRESNERTIAFQAIVIMTSRAASFRPRNQSHYELAKITMFLNY